MTVTGKTDIGRSSDLSVFSSSLKIGVTLATLHESGIWLVSIEQEWRQVLNGRQCTL